LVPHTGLGGHRSDLGRQVRDEGFPAAAAAERGQHRRVSSAPRPGLWRRSHTPAPVYPRCPAR